MDRSANLGNLKAEEWDQLQEAADSFEAAWRKEGPAEINQFLPPPGTLLRPLILQELIKIDLEFRWKRGQTAGLEFYLERYPELGNARKVSAQLIYEEFRARQAHGDKPALASYKNRYPDQFDELQRLVKRQPVQADVTRDDVAVTGQANTEALQEAPRKPKPKKEPPKQEPPKQEPSKKEGQGQEKSLHFGGEYKILTRLGSGGFGEVWRGEAAGGVEVAVKMIFRPLDHEEAQRELQSLELIKRLRHPYLLQTQAYYQHEDRLYIVMELADGSLRDRLKECRNQGLPGIPVLELVKCFRETAEALDYLHEHKVLHRDIKPENILLLQRHAKVADFGLARVQESQRMMSATGSGTPLYMAPEVWRGKVSPQSDQYSLALAYTELRLDRRIISGRDMMQIMYDHIERTPDLSPLPDAEQQVILRALSKDPEKRYPTCREFVEDLEKAIGLERGQQETAHGGTDTGRTPLPRRPKSSNDESFATMGGTGAPPSVAATIAPSQELTPAAGGTGRPRPSAGWRGSGGWRGSATLPLEQEADQKPKRKRWPFVAGGIVILLLVAVPTALTLQGSFHTVPKQTNREGEGPPLAAEKIWLPPGCAAAPGASLTTVDDKKLYDRIIKKKGTLEIPFLLIAKPETNDPTAFLFYIMENKVSNKQFEAALQDDEFKKRLDGFAQKDPWTVQRRWEKEPLSKKGADLPVVNVTVTEAHCFAKWLDGHLPDATQWYRAAGGYGAAETRGTGPFKNPPPGSADNWIAINRKVDGPLPVGSAAGDVSIFSCHDMAGNGYEWTRKIMFDTAYAVPHPQPMPDKLIQTVGRSFAASAPWTFKDMDEPETEEYRDCKPDVSFRVVLEVKP